MPYFRPGVIFPDGDLWRSQRKFMVKKLKESGIGKESMEEQIIDEVKFCLDHLLESCQKVRKFSLDQDLD